MSGFRSLLSAWQLMLSGCGQTHTSECRLQNNTTDHASTWRWTSLCGTSHRCSSWTRLDCPLLCSLCFGPDSAVCAVLDKVVDVPVIVQVSGMVQTVHISRSSWTRSLTARCCAVFVVVQTVQCVQFWTRLLTCPLLCNDIQRQVYVVGQSRKLWRSRSCDALIGGRCPCCAGRRLGLVGASDSVHRQSLWTFQFSTRRWAFSEGLAAMLGWAFCALFRVVPELSASFRSPR